MSNLWNLSDEVEEYVSCELAMFFIFDCQQCVTDDMLIRKCKEL